MIKANNFIPINPSFYLSFDTYVLTIFAKHKLHVLYDLERTMLNKIIIKGKLDKRIVLSI